MRSTQLCDWCGQPADWIWEYRNDKLPSWDDTTICTDCLTKHPDQHLATLYKPPEPLNEHSQTRLI